MTSQNSSFGQIKKLRISRFQYSLPFSQNVYELRMIYIGYTVYIGYIIHMIYIGYTYDIYWLYDQINFGIFDALGKLKKDSLIFPSNCKRSLQLLK